MVLVQVVVVWFRVFAEIGEVLLQVVAVLLMGIVCFLLLVVKVVVRC